MKKKRQPPAAPSKGVSRRAFLQQSSALGALPFTLAIPSNAKSVPTSDERMRPFARREAEFDKALDDKLAQLPGARPPPPTRYNPPPRIMTSTMCSKQTTETRATFSNRGGKEVSDDTNYLTFHDGNIVDDNRMD